MLLKHQHPSNKSIMISVLGVPNVGKSSLINYLLGTELSVVTHKPQTTRNKFHCVFNIDKTEVILVDTPGIHKSNKEFNKRLNEQAREGCEGVDLNFILVDLTSDVLPQLNSIKETLKFELDKAWLIFTKNDLVKISNDLLLEIFNAAKQLIPKIEKYFSISSKNGENIHLLTGAICDEAKTGYHLYPDGDVSNKNERFFVTEYIREQAFLLLNEELPYEIAVVVEEFQDGREDETLAKPIVHIAASIIVNRPSQRGIVVGKQGAVIKEIGTKSRAKIEQMLGCQVNLNLHVKVTPGWPKNNYVLESIGLQRAVDSNRVWRSR